MNRYVYCLNNPIKYIDPTGEFALAGSLGVALLSKAVPYIVTGVAVIVKVINFAKGGKQNKRSSEYRDVSDAELEKRYKDPNTSKKEKQKIKTEQKARKTRHSSQKK